MQVEFMPEIEQNLFVAGLNMPEIEQPQISNIT